MNITKLLLLSGLFCWSYVMGSLQDIEHQNVEDNKLIELHKANGDRAAFKKLLATGTCSPVEIETAYNYLSKLPLDIAQMGALSMIKTKLRPCG